MTLKENKCFCVSSMERPNDRDECTKCSVQGCLSCATSNEQKCLLCEDGLTLNDGECACPVDRHLMNAEGVC